MFFSHFTRSSGVWTFIENFVVSFYHYLSYKWNLIAYLILREWRCCHKDSVLLSKKPQLFVMSNESKAHAISEEIRTFFNIIITTFLSIERSSATKGFTKIGRNRNNPFVVSAHFVSDCHRHLSNRDYPPLHFLPDCWSFEIWPLLKTSYPNSVAVQTTHPLLLVDIAASITSFV